MYRMSSREPEIRLQEVLVREFGMAADTLAPALYLKSRMLFYRQMPAFESARLRASSKPLDRENYGHFPDNPLCRVA